MPAKSHKARTGQFLICVEDRGPFAAYILDTASQVSELKRKLGSLPPGTRVLVENAATGARFHHTGGQKIEQVAIDLLVEGFCDPAHPDIDIWRLPSRKRPAPAKPKHSPSQEVPPVSTFIPDVTMFTDGACSGNPGPAAFAAVMINGEPTDTVAAKLAAALRKADTAKVDGFAARRIAGSLGPSTNNVAELQAVLHGLDAIKKPCAVRVLTDSVNVIGWLQNGFKRKDPRIAQVAGQIDELIAHKGLTVEFVKTNGHAGVPLNELCDRLAKEAIVH